jgi:type I site-specific restriction endonuclease
VANLRQSRVSLVRLSDGPASITRTQILSKAYFHQLIGLNARPYHSQRKRLFFTILPLWRAHRSWLDHRVMVQKRERNRVRQGRD